MKVDIRMPQLGESITEGTIVKWWKKPGDAVKKDETLLEISTDKVDSEIPSPHEGILVELKANESETVTVNSIIAIIDTEANGAVASKDVPAAAAPAPAAVPAPAPAPAEPSAKPAPQMSPVDGTASAGMVDITMPQLGESITEGTIVKWWKKQGDSVKKDETLLEISTDKVDSEIPSPFSGTVTELLANENDTVQVGAIIARLKSGDAPAAAAAAPTVATPEAAPAVQKAPAAAASPSTAAPGVSNAPAARGKGGRFYSPLVRSIARKEGISMAELEGLPGSGLAGRVTKSDILGYIGSGRVAPVAAPAPVSAPASSPARAAASAPLPSADEVSAKWKDKRVTVVPMDNIRKLIADHMVASKSTSPHVYGVAEVDFTRVMALVKSRRDQWRAQHGFKLTINPCILYAVTKAVNDFPGVNGSVEGHTVIQKHFLNLGMAVATEKGLIVPVLKDADEKNFLGIARTAYDLAIKARDGKLKLDNIQGSTITVTNYGVFGNMIGYPIINQPNVVILGVAAIKKRPVVIESEEGDVIGIRQIGYMTLSYDHRIVDGELGDKFLQRVRHYLENFDESWF